MTGLETAEAFLESAVRTATPLAFAALGECVSERAGVINIGLEGAILAGALGATVGAGVGGVYAGIACGMAAGIGMALLFALFAVGMRADQIITGTAITVLALGLTGTLYRSIYGSTGVALSTPTLSSLPIPLLSQLPLVGPALFNRPIVTYLLYIIAPVASWWMMRTHAGLALRATGEEPAAAIAAGVNVKRVQWLAVLFAGLMAGIAGASLVLAETGTFAEGMSAGRGFIAIAVVVLGRWKPLLVLGAAMLFGAASASQFLFQSLGIRDVPYQLFLCIPYVLTLVVLASSSRRAAGPSALGRRNLDQRR